MGLGYGKSHVIKSMLQPLFQKGKKWHFRWLSEFNTSWNIVVAWSSKWSWNSHVTSFAGEAIWKQVLVREMKIFHRVAHFVPSTLTKHLHLWHSSWNENYWSLGWISHKKYYRNFSYRAFPMTEGALKIQSWFCKWAWGRFQHAFSNLSSIKKI